jgi:hypothetical protein
MTPANSPSEKKSEETFPIRLVKKETGQTHWNVAKGVWETVTHGETGEPDSQYVLLGTIDGVDVKLGAWNSGPVETLVKAQKQAQSQSES